MEEEEVPWVLGLSTVAPSATRPSMSVPSVCVIIVSGTLPVSPVKCVATRRLPTRVSHSTPTGEVSSASRTTFASTVSASAAHGPSPRRSW